MTWKIERIEPIPESTVVRPATGRKTFTYANMRWTLYERDGRETRIREVDGPPIYEHEGGDLAVLMRVIAEAVAPLSRRLLEMGSGYEVDSAFPDLFGLENDPEPRLNMIGFSNDQLERLPKVRAGSLVDCPKCGGKHKLKPCDDGKEVLLFYHCRKNKKSYLGAVSGRLVTQTAPVIRKRLT